VAGLQAYRAFRLYKLAGSGTISDCGEILQGRVDLCGPSNDMEAFISWNPYMLPLVMPQKGASYMLVNLSRMMTLDAGDPRTLAVAMRCYAYWHARKQRGIWNPDHLDWLNVDNLLVTANAVSDRVALSMGGADMGNSARAQTGKARIELLDRMLPKLVEAGILGAVDAKRPKAGSRGKPWEVKISPPEDWLEASKEMKKRKKED